MPLGIFGAGEGIGVVFLENCYKTKKNSTNKQMVKFTD